VRATHVLWDGDEVDADEREESMPTGRGEGRRSDPSRGSARAANSTSDLAAIYIVCGLFHIR
jgi:hypothetical protein